MIPGIEVDLGGTVYVVPPLSLASLESLQSRLANYKGGIEPEQIATVLDAAYLAIKRNYPAITREALADVIDVGNMMEVMQAVADAGGLKRKAIDAEKAKASSPP
jgi:hypothetical protein